MASFTLADLTFLFNIVPVKVKCSAVENRQYDGHWYPPTSKEDFVLDDLNSTGWCRWTVNGVQENVHPVNTSNADDDDDDVCSVFFDSERDQFLVTHFDCVQKSVRSLIKDMGIGWSRVTFQHLDNQGCGKISKVSFHTDDHWLAARGSPTWMPQLLPKTYDNNGVNEYTGLIGELSLLLAFAAFSCEPRRRDMVATINRCFRPPRWINEERETPSVSK